jgi:hypothetical protein
MMTQRSIEAQLLLINQQKCTAADKETSVRHNSRMVCTE